MSARGSPKSPSGFAAFRKPAQPSSQRKMLQEPPGDFNPLQTSQFHSGSQSPYRGRSPDLSAVFGRNAPSKKDVQARPSPELEDEEPEANMTKEGDNEIQVPSTNPDRTLTTPSSKSSGTRTHLSSERDTSPAQPSEERDSSDQELEDFDMEDFQKRFNDELCAIKIDEQELLRKFDRFSRTFAAWAQSASNRDADRASKRLKTRETFVGMAEQSLYEKRDHYEQVVQAFKAAMQLLQG